MSIITTDSAHYAAIAAAIREKNGESGFYSPSQMAAKIAAISPPQAALISLVGGAEQPAAPAEGTIWISTEADIGTYAVGYDQPAAPAEGDVWIEEGIESHRPLTVMEGESFLIYPVRAWQYLDSAWAEKTAMTYKDGGWWDWKKYLYDRGELYTRLTGGWKCAGRRRVSGANVPQTSMEISDGCLVGTAQVLNSSKGTGMFIRTLSAVKLTSYSLIRAKVSDINGTARLGVMQQSEQYLTLAASTDIDGTEQECSLDVSALSGSYYVGVAVETESAEAGSIGAKLHWLCME